LPNLSKVARVDETRHAEHHASEVAERERYTAQLVGRLRAVMYPQIDEQDLRRVQDLEDAVIPCVVEMEHNGAPIDVPLLEQYGAECSAAHDALMWEVSRECGHAFEHTPKGWARLLESLHQPIPDSFAEASLNEIDHPLVRKGQRAAQYASLNSKIFQAYPAHISDGLLRYEINQLASDEGGTVSGRFSIGLVQQAPNHTNHSLVFGENLFPRRLFIAGRGDFLEADAAQIEFRLLVHYSQNAAMLQAYRDNPHMSFHRQMQAKLTAYKPDMQYEHTKSYNFDSQYGARSIKLASMMGFITEREGDEIRKAKRWDDPRLKLIKEIESAYARAHPEAGALLDKASHLMKNSCDKYCKKGDALHQRFQHRGHIKTLLGRRSRCVNNYKPYIGLNRVLQGTGASIMKQKLVELHKARHETGFIMRITNHDAVLGDATQPETRQKVSEILNRQSFPLRVPILWECGSGQTWAECK
jgi:DNA polymerase I-like protein with 3'-5' exonuclease and polymerase domains